MKKTFFVSVYVMAIVMMVSCASIAGASGSAEKDGSSNSGRASSNSGRSVSGGIPKFIRDVTMNVPEDALIGIGTAKMATLSQSRTISATRARAELARQMDTIVRTMVRDFAQGNETDHSAALSFQEDVTVTLAEARLTGAQVIEEDMDTSGNYWTAISLSKTNAVKEINQAVAAAKLRIPAMASFDAESRMNAAFDRFYGNEIGYSDK